MSDPVPIIPEPGEESWYDDLSPELRQQLEAVVRRRRESAVNYVCPDCDQFDCECDDPSDDEDLFGFQGWTRGGTPIQEF